MNLLIKQALIVDPLSPLNGQTTDLFISNGIISFQADQHANPDHIIEANSLCVSPGWVDIFSNFADPGFEYKETIETGVMAAAAGGYTDVFLIPNTNPVLHNKSGIEYIIQKSQAYPVSIHPIGAITRNAEGKELAEMYDMKNSGAVAFSDGIHSVQQAGMLVKALQYIKAFNGIIIQVPDDKSFNAHGLMNEGLVSTTLGLPGKPSIAEELMVARDCELAGYAGSKIHFSGISTAGSLEHIRKARNQGIAVSCSVTPYHIFFADKDLAGYDTNLKVDPPLRTKTDRDALRTGLTKGDIDCIATHHLPHEYDSKVIEFEYAKPGMIGLATTYAALNTAIQGINQENLVSLLATNPRKLFGLDPATIKEGNKAILTLFDPAKTWTVGLEDLKSKSANSPFIGKELTGRPLGIINGNKTQLNPDWTK